MWPLEIVKSYHKIHAKRSNICNTLPKQNVADIFVAYLPQFCIQNKILRREKRRNVPPNQTILFIYYIISYREGTAEIFYSQGFLTPLPFAHFTCLILCHFMQFFASPLNIILYYVYYWQDTKGCLLVVFKTMRSLCAPKNGLKYSKTFY